MEDTSKLRKALLKVKSVLADVNNKLNNLEKKISEKIEELKNTE